MSDLTVQWKCLGKWVNFPLKDLNVKTRASALALFNRGSVDAVAKQNGEYFVSSNLLKKNYDDRGERVRTFGEVLAAGGRDMNEPFYRVGFGGAL